MTEILATQQKPQRNITRDEFSSPNCVRVYRQSPGRRVLLQLRRTKDYTSISLGLEEARALAAMLIAAAQTP